MSPAPESANGSGIGTGTAAGISTGTAAGIGVGTAIAVLVLITAAVVLYRRVVKRGLARRTAITNIKKQARPPEPTGPRYELPVPTGPVIERSEVEG